MDHLPSSYPLPKVHDNRVFFLDLNAFEATKIAKNEREVTSVSLKTKNARISAPVNSIRAAFDNVPFFQQDIFCTDISFEDKARLVYLTYCFVGEDKQDLYEQFKIHWLSQKEICPIGVDIIFLKDGVEDMRMSV
tara:strand:+ start:1627 stop:2031 length:405 start_codon:yes stop_codon:yes gene_type:complete